MYSYIVYHVFGGLSRRLCSLVFIISFVLILNFRKKMTLSDRQAYPDNSRVVMLRTAIFHRERSINFPMYSEQNRRTTDRRADQEFLRRMLGGTLQGDRAPGRGTCAVSSSPVFAPSPASRRASTGSCGSSKPQVCSDTLAMVTSPVQCWRELYSPAEALAHGTLFRELELPLEVAGGTSSCRMEVKTRRPM